MIRNLLAAIGLRAGAPARESGKPPYDPYANDATNTIYNLLFADDLSAFLAQPGETAAPWQSLFAAEPIDLQAMASLASDPTQEGRIRYLACSRLHGLGKPVPPGNLFGIVVEVPSANGLDVLAAYSDGGVRYLNQSGKIFIGEDVPDFQALVKNLFAAAQPVILRIGPWDKPRLPPPTRGNVRLTFLVSDGHYFGEGPIAVMQRDGMAGPIIHRATTLLQAVVKTGTT